MKQLESLSVNDRMALVKEEMARLEAEKQKEILRVEAEKLEAKARKKKILAEKKKEEILAKELLDTYQEEYKEKSKGVKGLTPELKSHLDIIAAAKGHYIDSKKEYEATFKEYNTVKKGSIFDIQRWYRLFKLKTAKTTAIYVNMELRNGMHIQFVAYISHPYFIWKKGLYIIDDELKYWNSTVGMFAIDYHQDLSLPIKKKVNVNEIKHTVESVGGFEVETALNPHSLKQWLESDVVQKIIKGQELDQFMRRLMTISIIGALAAIAMLLLFMWKSGMFEQIQGQIGI